VSQHSYAVVTELEVDEERAAVHPAGWQSWSPEDTFPLDASPPVPARPVWQTMAFRPERPVSRNVFQGEGMLTVDPGDGGPVLVVAGVDPEVDIPSIRACVLRPGVLQVSSDGPVVVHAGVAADLPGALAWWADGVVASRVGASLDGAAHRRHARLPEQGRLFPAVWCSWYCYWRSVTADVVIESGRSCRRLGIDVGVVQIDDGWQAAIGDWNQVAPRFGDLDRAVASLREEGFEVGIWLAPFLAVQGSELVRRHPDWLVPELSAGENWGSDLRVIDTTHPGATDYLRRCVEWLAGLGITYFKLDFLYAGAMEGQRHTAVPPLVAYRDALSELSAAAGPDATVLGCGAPLLASVGLVDAMRISPDVMPVWEPPEGDLSQPGGRSAVRCGSARSYLDRRWWLNDPDCLLARPQVERRSDWAAHLTQVGGLRSCSDPLDALDAWGLETTRRLMHPVRL
jgi:alpha-galactosidase